MAEPDDDPEAIDTDEALVDEIMGFYRRSRDHFGRWRQDAREEFGFVAGQQWSVEDAAALEKMNRPVVVFNRTAPVIDAVVGQEANSRHEVRYIPRTMDDTALNEAATAMAKWVMDECDGGDEEAEAFRDMLICGMGWTETRMDMELDPEGVIVRERVDPLEMYPDPVASKRNLADGRALLRLRVMDERIAKARFDDLPERADGVAEFDDADNDDRYPHDASNAWKYENEGASRTLRNFATVKIGEYQWYDVEEVYRIGRVDRDFSDKEFDRLRPRLDKMGIPYVQVARRKYQRAFIARGKILQRKPNPCEAFTYQCLTGKRDRNHGTFYGMVRGMKDPQRWANKFFSSILHVISTNAKGGVLAETDAFQNPRKAESDWADPSAIVWLNPGGSQKVEQRPAPAYPTGMDRLLEFSISSVRDTTGVNVELLGMADREQAGILEVQRKQSAITILAPYFDSLKRYRRDAGRILLTFIRKYLPERTMMRVLGPEMAMAIPLLKDETAYRFDVVVEEGPYTPNQKEQTMSVMLPLLPEALKLGIPVPPDVLDYLPLPAPLLAKWKAYIQAQAQSPEAQAAKQLTLAQQAADVAKTQGLADAAKARAQQLQGQNPQLDAIIKIGQQAAQLQMDVKRMQMEMAQSAQEMALEQQKHQAQLAMDGQRHVQDMALQRDQASQQAEISAFKAQNDAQIAREKAKQRPTIN